MQFGAHLVTKQHDISLIPHDLQMGYPATTILFIDSHEDARQYFVQRLTISSPDYVVLEADTGASGLSICKSCRIDCVVLDVDLPDMSGFHVLTVLVPRVLRPQIPIIILTGLNISTMPELALKNGALAYLIKSRTSGDDLDKVIHKALAIVPPTRKEPRP